MEGTLVLHVIRGDQDYDSSLGNDFLRHQNVKRVTVLTHCDMLPTEEEARKRIMDTLNETSKNSIGTYAVNGSQDDDSNLDILHSMDKRVVVGAEVKVLFFLELCNFLT